MADVPVELDVPVALKRACAVPGEASGAPRRGARCLGYVPAQRAQARSRDSGRGRTTSAGTQTWVEVERAGRSAGRAGRSLVQEAA
eukprot:9245416-Alexandrium_andersonii.AAC.1